MNDTSATPTGNEQPTWRDLAVHAPQFVQWCAATHGPLPDGPIKQEDYERLRAAHKEAIRGT